MEKSCNLQKPLIDGVRIKRLKLIPDDRGFLMEMLRCDDEIFKGFGQVYITGCIKGVAKAWHYHREQTDNFVCVYGTALVVLCDLREGSSTYGKVNEFILHGPSQSGSADKTGDEQILLQIPPMVVHGFTAYNCDDARVVNVPTLPYRYENPDEFRYPWNSEKIPYRWPEYVVRGG